MRPRTLFLSLVASLALALGALPTVASSVETPPTIEAVYPHWSPEQEAIKLTTKTVDFVNKNGILHGIHWTGGPAEPKCTGVPINSSSASWSGSCEFEQEGTYTFVCTVHAFMTGTVCVNATGTIPSPPPLATTEPASSIGETGATLHGTVNPNGQETTYEFQYGLTSSSYESATSPAKLSAGSANVPVSNAIAGLSPGTLYHYRLVAKSAAGTTDGTDQTLTTSSPPPPPGPPVSVTEAATSVTEGEATLKGAIDPDGQTTSYVFEYGPDTAYGQHTTEVPLGASDHTSHSVSATVTGLTPGTHYHFRLRATNASGSAEGADREFTTSSPAPPSPPQTPPSPPQTPPSPPQTPPSPPRTPPTSTTPSATTPSALPAVTEPPALTSPLAPGSLKLVAGRRGSLRVSLAVLQAGAPARLEIDLLAKVAHSHKQALVGRLVRGSLAAGKASLSVALNARGKRALRKQHKLAVSVKLTLTPPMAARPVTVTRRAVLRA